MKQTYKYPNSVLMLLFNMLLWQYIAFTANTNDHEYQSSDNSVRKKHLLYRGNILASLWATKCRYHPSP